MTYSPGVVVISLPCTSGIRPSWILHAIEQGFDGVFIASDGDECAYLADCSTRASRIVAEAQELLVEAGHEPQRLKMAAICSVCAEPFTRHVQQFGQALGRAGPVGGDVMTDYDVLVVGAGIGGMESALKLGDMGYQVLLVEKEASVGGKMILLSKVFPTLDCASCISTPKMAASIHHPNVTTLTYSEVDGIEPIGDGRFTRDDHAEGALRRRGGLHRLPEVRDGLHRVGARPVQRGHGRPPRGLHRLPAGRAQEGGHRARRLVAVLVHLPGRDPGPRLRVAHPQRRVREGVPARPRRDAARRHARARLLRAVRGRLHARLARGTAADPSAQAVHRRRALRRTSTARASRSPSRTAIASRSSAPARPA